MSSRIGLRPRARNAGRSLQQGVPPPPNPADADDARLLRASATHSKTGKVSPRAAGPVAGAPSAHDAPRRGEQRGFGHALEPLKLHFKKIVGG